MDQCIVCGNHYHNCFEIRQHGTRYVFDSFECAIQKLAPVCSHCSCRIIGHGVEAEGKYFCCAHCAHEGGVTEATDHVMEHEE
jgi:hypothetical protein